MLKSITKSKKKVTDKVNNNKSCCIVLLVVIVGAVMIQQGILFSGESTIPTSTLPTTTTTTNSTTSTSRYVARCKWDFVPIMQIDGPEWVDAQISSYPDDEYFDSASMAEENIWYDTINHATIDYALGDRVLIFIIDSAGWNFNLIPDAVDHSKYLVEVGTDITGDLYPMDTDQDWGNFWLEWVLV